ncbi:anthranilate synthase, component I [Amycolatopsis xylanica]|uniref:Anthranilate synthase n=1 Tax=Amycolatopsis xylanica TaxID=589385 RepID=A0A1H2WCA4_9PSEU|nr:anthranilate synthase component I [Amycolatopsis xylanica]SDW77679.1 anthranilate synthase, component I [Amycolatopsis xylanica]
MFHRPAPGSARDSWLTTGGVLVTRTTAETTISSVRVSLPRVLDRRRGMVMTCGVAGDDRYHPLDVGYIDPPLEITASGRRVTATALNDRGRLLLRAVIVAWHGILDEFACDEDSVRGVVPEPARDLCEERRTRRHTVFTALRALVEYFAGPADPYFGLYGAFGYDLVFQFDDVPRHQDREAGDRDLVLHLPDRIDVHDRAAGTAVRHSYEFEIDGIRTTGMRRETETLLLSPGREPESARDHAEGEYADLVRLAQAKFKAGDLFEVVPGQCFRRAATAKPSRMFERLRERNPAPYGLLANLGDGEHLVSASPEMYVRVDRHGQVESCPISGTIARGRDALEDADRIKLLLNSAKEESELTMCTDVDRNDKARVCEPGSVRVLKRRQIEMYSTLIHTSDHVAGTLKPDRDALDAFLTHAWAVTVTGAPKHAAIAFIEEHERSQRRWYGGAFGRICFDGTLETALTLRTIQLRDGVATIRAGATLLHDSEPDAEERETELKALALLDAVEREDVEAEVLEFPVKAESRQLVLLVDHEDSFVQTLADYFRQAGAEVITYRHGFGAELLDELEPDLLVLSPGPGRPADFEIDGVLSEALIRRIPVFGVCLGLQGIVEYFGGDLAELPAPAHGKPARIELTGGRDGLFHGLPRTFEAGRYHSLHADDVSLPGCLEVTARTGDGLVMAVEHRSLPIAAVQFHPESILTQQAGRGHSIIANALTRLAGDSAWGQGGVHVAHTTAGA